MQRAGPPEISIIFPIFNECENIVPLLEELDDVLIKLNRPYELIAVDDGSTDGSREILLSQADLRKHLKLIFFRKNSGQSSAFDAGFRNASGNVIVTIDGDRQNDPHDIPMMLDHLENGFEFVAGWRRKRRDPMIKIIPSKVANWIIRKVTGSKLHDLGCTLKAYRREITEELHLYGEVHRFLGVLVEQLGARITEVETNHRPRQSGISKYGTGRAWRVLLDLLTIWFLKHFRSNPGYIFGNAALALITASFLTCAVVIYEKIYWQTWVHRNPLFILAITALILGIQFLGMGLIAELIVRLNYETKRKPTYLIAKLKNFDFPMRET